MGNTYENIIKYAKEQNITLGTYCYEDTIFDRLVVQEEKDSITRLVYEIE